MLRRFLVPAFISNNKLPVQIAKTSAFYFLKHHHQNHLFTLTSIRFCCSGGNNTTTTTSNENESEDISKAYSKGDYYRIKSLDAATPPPEVIEWRSARGSGPGGQAVNTSQNKAELRLNLNAWHEADPTTFDFDTLEKLQKDFGGKLITKDDILIVSSHAHRSMEKNKEECLEKVKKLVRDASYVPPVAAPKMQFDPNYFKKVVMPKKRMKSNFNKMKRTAKAGNW